MFLFFFTYKKFMVLQKVANIGKELSKLGMFTMNVTLMIIGLVEVGRKPVLGWLNVFDILRTLYNWMNQSTTTTGTKTKVKMVLLGDQHVGKSCII